MTIGGDIGARSLDERLGVLLGERGDPSQAAVRRADLDKILQDAFTRYFGETEDAAEKPIGSFNSVGDLETGFHTWDLATTFKPPIGGGGPAMLMKRNETVGAWLAAWTGPGDRELSLFARGQSWNANQYGNWRELYHEGNIIGGCSFADDGKPLGAIFQLIENGGGVCLRFASGLQVCYQKDQTVFRTSNDTLQRTWFYASVFSTPPVAWPVIPALPRGVFTIATAIQTAIPSSEPAVDQCVMTLRRASGTNYAVGAQLTNVDFIAVGKWYGS